MFNPAARMSTITIAPGRNAYVIDDALLEPQRWVDLAVRHRADFETLPHNAYPGVELRMPDAITASLDAFFARHVRALLGARRTLRCYSRLSLATRLPEQLEPRQWICHRDRLDPASDRCVAACVLYLFRDPLLGGTAFFTPTRSAHETDVLIHESGVLAADAFRRKYGIVPGYQTASNAWFEKTGSVSARWNRLVFYDGGSVFHSSDIGMSEWLSDDPAGGRLTLNGFFVCRRAVSVP